MPPLPKSYPNVAVSPVAKENSKRLESGVETQLRVDLPTLVQPPLENDFISNAVPQALVPETRQQVDELLPWEIQGEAQPAKRKVRGAGEQQKEDTRDAKNSGEDHSCILGNSELRDDEHKGAEASSAKGPDVVEERARKVISADENIVQETSADHLEAKKKLALEKNAAEAETDRKHLGDEKKRAEKLRVKILAQEQEAKEKEIRKEVATKEAKAALKKAWEKERSALNKARKKNIAQSTPTDVREAQDVKEVPVGQEPLTRDMAEESGIPNKVVTCTKRKAISPSLDVNPAKTPKPDDYLDARNRKSSTPSSMRSGSDRVSMTPAVPGVIKRPPNPGNSTVTSGTSAQTPLRSALRQNSSISRRSVSFVEDPSDPVNLESSPSTAATGKSNVTKSKRSLVKAAEGDHKSRTSSTTGSSMSRSSEAPKQSKESSKTPAIKEKLQTKLHVKHDKKLKGREIDPPPKPPEPAIQEDIVITSDSEKSVSTFYSDEEDKPRNAKAGPSSKKKPNTVDEKAADTTKSTSTPNAIASKLRQSSSQNAESPSHNAVPKAVAEAPTRLNSPSRSPAQYMSKAGSASSNTGSESGSSSECGGESDSESGSESGSSSDSEPKLPALPRAENNEDRAEPSLSKVTSSGDIEIEDVSSRQSTSSLTALRPSQLSTVGPQGSKKLKKDDTQFLSQDADQQLLRECRKSLSPSIADKRSKTPDPHNVKVKPNVPTDKSLDPDHPVRQRGKPSGIPKQVPLKENAIVLPKPAPKSDNLRAKTIRPANQRYLSITEVMKQPKIEIKSQPSRQKPADSQARTTSVPDDSESSSSESESESPNDEDDEISSINDASQISTPSKNKAPSGVKGVLKRTFPWLVTG